jgi:hypothetical protein
LPNGGFEVTKSPDERLDDLAHELRKVQIERELRDVPEDQRTIELATLATSDGTRIYPHARSSIYQLGEAAIDWARVTDQSAADLMGAVYWMMKELRRANRVPESCATTPLDLQFVLLATELDRWDRLRRGEVTREGLFEEEYGGNA